MDDLLTDAKRLLAETEAKDGSGLRAALEPFVRTLEADGRPQGQSTDALSRFCVEHMDWTSPLYVRCTDLVKRAKADL
ncbi:MAG: hypothetical protein KKA45_08125 [Alphaproteobacteria bacterium]|jgi:hypothetical protein|nr:hypothetical protein [Alphaproteobacteria bacterium]